MSKAGGKTGIVVNTTDHKRENFFFDPNKRSIKMNIDEEEFQDEFSTFGVSLDSEDIISKLRELCQRYR